MTWEKVAAAGTPPVFEGDAFTKGAYVAIGVASETERVAMLHAKGHDLVYVNGELRPGDPYGYGWLRLPVLLRAGENEFLFRVSRGRLEARLEEPPAEVFVLAEDATLPTREPGAADLWGAAVVVNAQRREARIGLACEGPRGRPGRFQEFRSVPPLSVRKLPVVLPPMPFARSEGDAELQVASISPLVGTTVADPPLQPRLEEPTAIPWRGAGEHDPVRRKTFVSTVDGSVQYYATCEPWNATAPRALVLSLHGAGVEADGQAASYAPKRWATILCPTNRRPYGFDWEDWGRLDALEALSVELLTGRYDRTRVHLTGHSMGGHGAWHLGVTYPDRFATVAPSAGWRTFSTYGGGPTGDAGPVEALLRRASSAGDVPSLAGNLATKGVYVLHGDADDNVPVTEARAMVERLEGVVADLHVHEQKGAGHWWDADPEEDGTDCVDWAPMFDLMARRRLPAREEVRAIDFTTASPGVSARCAWAVVECQQAMHVPSRVGLRFDPGRQRVTGTTENVRTLVLDAGLCYGRVTISLDGSPDVVTLGLARGAAIRLTRGDGGWSLDGGSGVGWKGPERYGPFKEVFRHRFVFVVGTVGTPEENAWAARKARLDAETWWYRANGSVDVVEDQEYLQDVDDFQRRNVVLYGHAEMNAAWAPLLGKAPVRVARGVLRVGDHEEKGDDLACLFLHPRPETDGHLVGVVAGTGLPGLRLTDRLPYFTSGVAVPDLVVLSTSMLTRGVEGLVGAGFFGPDWSVASGEFAWRASPPVPPTDRPEEPAVPK